MARGRSAEETYRNDGECYTDLPIVGIEAPSLASLSMSDLPIVLMREDLRQVNDSIGIGGHWRSCVTLPCRPPPAVSTAGPLHGAGDEGGTLGRVVLACQYLCGDAVRAARMML